VGAGQGAVSRVVLVEVRDDGSGARGVAPVTHQLAHDVEERHDIDTGVAHAVVGRVTDQLGAGARSLDVGPNAVPRLLEGERQEGRACEWGEGFC
jgi:hypothetical protein